MKTTLGALLFSAVLAGTAGAANPFVGSWALTIPGGGAGWLGVEEKDGGLAGSILWGGGSVVPVQAVKVDGDTLVVTRLHTVKRDGREERETETIAATRNGDALALVTERQKADGSKSGRAEFTGKRIPPVPPAPDLAKVKYGDAIRLFNGKDLTGWWLTNPGQANGWSVQDGVLVNRPEQAPGQPHKNYGNLRTEQAFEDFNLTLEVRVPPKGNSGIYLRGIYEVQVCDSHGSPLDSHNMGGIYSRIAPTAAAERPAGEWQTMAITLVDRHVTVSLNGTRIIDNQPLRGCTGGAMWSDEFRPGPIYLQGDHTGVDYRNLVLRPVVKPQAEAADHAPKGGGVHTFKGVHSHVWTSMPAA